MKNLLILLILSWSVCYGQQDSLGNLNNKTGVIEKGVLDVPFAIIEDVPLFPGCERVKKSKRRKCFQEKMANHISKNIRYPEFAQRIGIEGRVYVQFIIDTDSSVTRIRTRGPHKILEMEAYRIITKLPKITPGKIKGRPVRVPFFVPITFRLNKPKPPASLTPLNQRIRESFDRGRPPL